MGIITRSLARLDAGLTPVYDSVLHARRPADLVPIPAAHYVHHARTRFAAPDPDAGRGQLGRGFYTWVYLGPSPGPRIRCRLELAPTGRRLGAVRVLMIHDKGSPEYQALLLTYRLALWHAVSAGHYQDCLNRRLRGVDLVIMPVDAAWEGLRQAVFRPTPAARRVLAGADATWIPYDKARHRLGAPTPR